MKCKHGKSQPHMMWPHSAWAWWCPGPESSAGSGDTARDDNRVGPSPPPADHVYGVPVVQYDGSNAAEFLAFIGVSEGDYAAKMPGAERAMVFSGTMLDQLIRDAAPAYTSDDETKGEHDAE